MGKAFKTLMLAVAAATVLSAQAPKEPDWKALEEETMRQFQAVLRSTRRNPPGNEHLGAEYLKQRVRQGRHPGADLRARCRTARTSSRG